MDQQLKARLIGAAVLVALAVIVIPELLSGRKTVESSPAAAPVRGKRTYTIDLGGGSTGVASRPTLVPQPAAATPHPQEAASPAAAEPAVAAPERASVEMPPPAKVEAAALPAPDKEPVRPATGGWAVQVGAFGNAAAAQKLVTELQGQGYAAFVSPVTRGGRTLHRVRVGPAADRAATDQIAQQLKARGLPATVVAND